MGIPKPARALEDSWASINPHNHSSAPKLHPTSSTHFRESLSLALPFERWGIWKGLYWLPPSTLHSPRMAFGVSRKLQTKSAAEAEIVWLNKKDSRIFHFGVCWRCFFLNFEIGRNMIGIPSSSSSLYIFATRGLVTWYIGNWEVGSKDIRNWKMRVYFTSVLNILRRFLLMLPTGESTRDLQLTIAGSPGSFLPFHFL